MRRAMRVPWPGAESIDQGAAGIAGALAHAEQTQARAADRLALIDHLEAAAVVFDFGDQRFGQLAHGDADLARAGVLLAVVQRLLHDAVDAGLHGVGQLVGDAFFDELADDAAAAQEIFELELQGGDQAEIVEQGGPQQAGDVADGLDGAFGQFAGALQAFAEDRRRTAGKACARERFRSAGVRASDRFRRAVRARACGGLPLRFRAGGRRGCCSSLRVCSTSAKWRSASRSRFSAWRRLRRATRMLSRTSDAKHQEEPSGGAAARAGEFTLAILQPSLVGEGQIAKGVIKFAAARHDFALQEVHLFLAGGVKHGAGQGLDHGPEFAQAGCAIAGTTER